MGNQQSTAEAISSTVNKSVNNIMMQNSSSCTQNNSGIQDVDFSHITTGPGCNLGITSSQKFSQIPTFSCLSNASQNSNLQSQLSAALSQAVKSETSGVSGALNSASNSKTISNIVNNLTNNVDISNTASCLQNNLANQTAIFKAISSSCPKICNQELSPSMFNSNFTLDNYNKLCTTNINSTQELIRAATAACTSENKSLQSAINKAAAEVSQIASSENAGINLATLTSSFFSGLSGLTSGPMLYSVIAIVCLVFISVVGGVIFALSPAGQQATGELASAGAKKLAGHPF